jgi:hypothetical protein
MGHDVVQLAGDAQTLGQHGLPIAHKALALQQRRALLQRGPAGTARTQVLAAQPRHRSREQ